MDNDAQPLLDGGWAAPFLEGRKVFITGGTSGIGRGIARGFAMAGAEVIATGVSEAEVSAAAQWAESLDAPGSVSVDVLDVCDAKAVETKVGGIGDLHALVNCAGLIRRGAELDPEVFAKVVEVNLTGSMRCAHAAKPALQKTGGTVVNTASMLSFFGGGLVPGYAASKGGIAQLTKSLAIAWAKDGIRVNAIAPGWIRTPLTTDLQADSERETTILGRTPMGRWGEAGDLSGPAMFLCTPLSGFMTGVVMPVDGGYSVA
ncbi:SDR family NAD(P)-dependent oxidoreductase [Limimaricola pyoseonensis]|uniref:NAD(P)-dependent dehydrogenase, short-chain alcohol dehydrogenase family n=1 Tax=Limimaricola pyoseonensis TaxID=521013 RepID=A0A1G6ZNP0_9RHOB|nr:SDR family oxidoreductase [Limimaricola pyoseonensis]SDE04003.1 NAD(P)-dependent dehydrogenase, short-chain alcohol dehydrogenase family [Limimaricola pyoseonensis]